MLRARNYHVSPLGPQCGLIQWVQFSRPLYGMVRQWHSSVQARAKAQQDDANAKPSAQMKPGAIFFEKLMPALKKHGISKLTSRQKWPLAALVEVRGGFGCWCDMIYRSQAGTLPAGTPHLGGCHAGHTVGTIVARIFRICFGLASLTAGRWGPVSSVLVVSADAVLLRWVGRMR